MCLHISDELILETLQGIINLENGKYDLRSGSYTKLFERQRNAMKDIE